jgi:hypothetical protein
MKTHSGLLHEDHHTLRRPSVTSVIVSEVVLVPAVPTARTLHLISIPTSQSHTYMAYAVAFEAIV